MNKTVTVSLDMILKLGDPRLYEVSEPVDEGELSSLLPFISRMHALILLFRDTYGAGRAIAAPQTGLMKRIICLNIDEPRVFINPVLTGMSKEMMELWDDCMSFPDLLVRVSRHCRCTLHYLDLQWRPRELLLEGDLSELIQHEYDHLNGILAIQRAIDNRSFRWRTQ